MARCQRKRKPGHIACSEVYFPISVSFTQLLSFSGPPGFLPTLGSKSSTLFQLLFADTGKKLDASLISFFHQLIVIAGKLQFDAWHKTFEIF